MKIGVCDSGLGGLTVLRQLVKRYPNHDYLYYGDTKHLPYGEKTKSQLMEYASGMIDYFKRQDVGLIVIACGTISTNIYEELRQKYSIPMIDIISPTIDYLKEKNFSSIGVLATPMTIHSHVFDDALCHNTTTVACPKFVPLIENGKMDSPECKDAISLYLRPMIESKVEHIVLGCTHYPILVDNMENEYPCDYIDMGDILATYLKLGKNTSGTGSVELYFSQVTPILEKMIDLVFPFPYHMNKEE